MRLHLFSFCLLLFAVQSAKAQIPGNMVLIETGIFLMGSPSNEPERRVDETPHRVTINSFYMGKYQVTQKEYQDVMGTNPSNFKGGNLPVETVSWYDAVEYCNTRSEQEGLMPVYTIDNDRSYPGIQNEYANVWRVVTWNRNADGYRLPTEAEWEYACRAGTTTPFNTGYNITTDHANYNGNYPYYFNATGAYQECTMEVGSFEPNRWGLYDMHGNVREWCWDWYGDYGGSAQINPTGASLGFSRVLRGGHWNGDGRGLRSAYRSYYAPPFKSHSIGFRIVRNAQ